MDVVLNPTALANIPIPIIPSTRRRDISWRFLISLHHSPTCSTLLATINPYSFHLYYLPYLVHDRCEGPVVTEHIGGPARP